MNLSDSKKKLALAGVVCGIVAAVLAATGNPANMAICIACFVRDTAGALKFHSAAAVQYARPEIVGIVLGAFAISLATKEYRSTGGSSPMIRFVLGMIIMIGSLAFLGCPLRMVLRMSAGDLNAWVALIGFAAGVATGAFFLKKGFSLGRAHETNAASGTVLPILMVGILILSVCTTLLAASEPGAGPGALHAPILISLIGGLIFGAFAQKSRMCFAGSIRDIILVKSFDLISVIVGLFAVMLIYNIATGGFHLGIQWTADRTFRASVEYSRNVCGRIRGSTRRWMSASPARSGRTGIFRFRSDGSGTVCRARRYHIILDWPAAAASAATADKAAYRRRSQYGRTDRGCHLYRRMFYNRIDK